MSEPTLVTLTTPGTRWVDCSSLGHDAAWYAAVAQAGYAGVALDVATGAVAADVQAARAHGLAVMLFEGYDPVAWRQPDQASLRAHAAVQTARAAGYPPGAVLWLDSEAWPAAVSVAAMQAWCRQWARVVQAAAYLPGLYLGLPQPVGTTPGDVATAATGCAYVWRGSPDAPVPAGLLGLAQVAWMVPVAGVTVDESVVHGPVPVMAPDPPPTVAVPRAVLAAWQATLAQWLARP